MEELGVDMVVCQMVMVQGDADSFMLIQLIQTASGLFW